ncbi:hypothetical protein [Salmonirosea aquatica]|uniref:Curlin n=1 Tax=Salmonirosea aquatica TaxID=2654236 RepID=A0A7C9BE46_9BACT|nr:hypothetical protein [Cytophagaceae bacterium SJW1-29]
MKKIILSLGMLIAVATASYAQNNTATLNQNNGARNTGNMTQNGQNNQARINQNGVVVTDNKAVIMQTGKSNQALIDEAGKLNDVMITQSNTSVANHDASVQIINNDSENNYVRVTQSGKGMRADIQIRGDGMANGGSPVIFNQSGDTNRARLLETGGNDNDYNAVSLTQSGKDGQSYTNLVGDNNSITINQAGNTNNIGNFAGGGPAIGSSFTRTRVLAGPNQSLAGPNFLGADGTAVGIGINAGITVVGDMNTISVTQGAASRNNFAGIQLNGTQADGANQNKATINQADNAEDNQALIVVNSNQDRNAATINQTGFAQFNRAAIIQNGSDDIATINQSGKFNVAVTQQQIGTNTGSNVATINQPGNNNTAYTFQEGQIGSRVTITQNTNGHIAEVYQIGNGNHDATITQESVTGGSRLILQQEGTANKAFLTQKDIQGLPTDVEIRQTGMNNTVNGIATGGVTRFIQQNGNNNVINL